MQVFKNDKTLDKASTNNKTAIQSLAIIFFLSLSNMAHATTIESILNQTVSYLQGSLARGVGLVSIITSGYLCIAKQKLPKETFVMILVGLGIIYGSTSIYASLIG